MVTIKGAGIQGLACAWALKEHKPELHEASDRAGGLIETAKGKYFFELGPRGFRPKGMLEFVAEVGLEKELIYPPAGANIRYIYTENGLRRFPGEFKGLILRGLLRDLFLPSRPYHTIHDYFSYRFGGPFTRQIVDPAVAGIYAGDIGKLSFKGCFPDVEKVARESRSLMLGFLKRKSEPKMSPLVSFREGMETLPRTLSAFFPIHYRSMKACDVDCTPQYPKRASLLVINLGYSKPVLKHKGFGYLVPSYLKEPILGCVFDSNVFPQHNQRDGETRLTLMCGGDLFPEVFNDPLLIEKVLVSLKRHLGIFDDPDYIQVTKRPDAIPQYDGEGDGNGVNDAVRKGLLKGREYAALAHRHIGGDI